MECQPRAHIWGAVILGETISMRLIVLPALAGICGLALAGCAQTVWNKPGATMQDFATDSYECERDARMSGYFGGGLVGAINFDQFEQRCMMARGWSKSVVTAASGH